MSHQVVYANFTHEWGRSWNNSGSPNGTPQQAVSPQGSSVSQASQYANLLLFSFYRSVPLRSSYGPYFLSHDPLKVFTFLFPRLSADFSLYANKLPSHPFSSLAALRIFPSSFPRLPLFHSLSFLTSTKANPSPYLKAGPHH